MSFHLSVEILHHRYHPPEAILTPEPFRMFSRPNGTKSRLANEASLPFLVKWSHISVLYAKVRSEWSQRPQDNEQLTFARSCPSAKLIPSLTLPDSPQDETLPQRAIHAGLKKEKTLSYERRHSYAWSTNWTILDGGALDCRLIAWQERGALDLICTYWEENEAGRQEAWSSWQ